MHVFSSPAANVISLQSLFCSSTYSKQIVVYLTLVVNKLPPSVNPVPTHSYSDSGFTNNWLGTTTFVALFISSTV